MRAWHDMWVKENSNNRNQHVESFSEITKKYSHNQNAYGGQNCQCGDL